MSNSGSNRPVSGSGDYPSSVPGDSDPDVRRGSNDRNPEDKQGKDVQPGTGKAGESWQSRSPDVGDKDDELNEALKDSFPASDPPAATQPGVTGWDLTEEEEEKAGGV